jgi:hypothetical protein
MILVQKTGIFVCLASLPFFLVLGCGGSSNQPKGIVAQQDAELNQLYECYQHHIKSEQKPPAKQGDLLKKQYEGVYPAAIDAVKKGKYAVVWNVNDKGSGTVLAYEKDAPTQGGRVLMADGSVRTMSADEFKAAKPNSP